MNFSDVRKELLAHAYDPNKVQIDTYRYLETLIEGNDIPEPTNPFTFLVESNAMVGSMLLEEMKINLRKLYPMLAKNKDDLYNHIYDKEIENIFAYPSMSSFNIALPVKEIIRFGEDKDEYYELVIPAYTKLIVKDFYYFTFLNNTVIRYFKKTNKPMVIEMPNVLPIAFTGDRILNSDIIIDSDNLKWVYTTVELKQIDLNYIKQPIIPTEGFNKVINFKDQFNTIFGRVMTNTVGLTDVKPVFSNFVYDVKDPILRCKLKDDNNLSINLYDLFVKNNMVTQIELLMSTTKGNLKTSFSSLTRNDFKLDFSLAKTILNNVGGVEFCNPIITSNSYVNGGRDILTTEELKQIIVNSTTGANKLPITSYDIKERVSRFGYVLKPYLDSILRRQYIVTKDLTTNSTNPNFYASADIILDTLSISYKDIPSLPKKVMLKDGMLVIEPFTFFKKEGTVFKTLNDIDVSSLLNLPLDKLHTKLKSNRYFYNIYKYVCDFKEAIDYRIYDVNTPKVNYIKTVYYNGNMNYLLLYKNNRVIREGHNYKLIITFDTDETTRVQSDNSLKALLVFKANKHSSKVAIDGEFNLNSNELIFNFELDNYINADDEVVLKNTLHTENMMAIVASQIGPDYCTNGGSFFLKPPHYGTEVAWHQDSRTWVKQPRPWPPEETPRLFDTWIAFDHATKENGLGFLYQ